MSSPDYLLEVNHLTKYYPQPRRHFACKQINFAAVDDVSIKLAAGKTLGILGQSGSGKTTLARCLLGLIPFEQGVVNYHGQPVKMNNETERRAWLKKINIIFQDSQASFDPKRTLAFSLKEALQAGGRVDKDQYDTVIEETLDLTGLGIELLNRYPRQLSGGQCQRMSIARNLLLQPEILICDEPVSALDLTIQMQILNLLKQLQQTKGLSYVFISHDLNVINYMSDEVAVIYRGSIVEKGYAETVLKAPAHPYSKMLLASLPGTSPATTPTINRINISGQEATNTEGCKYWPQCRQRTPLCRKQKPDLQDRGNCHYTACHNLLVPN